MDKQSKQYLLYLVGGVVIVLVLFAVVKQYLAQKDGLGPTPDNPTSKAASASMYFMSPSGQTLFSADSDEEIVFDLYIDSKEMTIGGYDAAFAYNGDVLQFESATSLIDGYQVYASSIEDASETIATTSVTGIREIETVEQTAFEKKPVARLVFTPRAEGSTILQFIFEKGETNDSNVVLLNADDILTKVEDMTVNIGTFVDLQLGESATIEREDDSNIVVTLDSTTTPEETCADCFTSAEISVDDGSDVETATFELGGIAGKIVDTKTVLGYTIEVQSIEGNSARLGIFVQ